MKKIFSILMVAMAAMTMMFASCGKDDKNDNNTPTEAAPNTMVLDGHVYQLNSHYNMGGDRTYAGAETVDLDANGDPLYTIIADVEGSTLNHTYTFPNIHEYGVVFWSIHDANWEFQLGPELEEGTMTISKTDDLFVYKVDGSIGDMKVSFNISVPASEWEYVEY